ncbi:phage tail protein [Flavisolibacter sp. BT320]|nr:phage tail protein [Flavisolibacter longurius]
MAMEKFQYPLTGFHFLVSFELFPQTPYDVRFQEVSGLSMSMNVDTVSEGGENRFQHKLPTKASFSDITLKRGLFLHTELYRWCKDAIENFDFKPLNLAISLLDEVHAPVYVWRVFNAIPIKWELSSFGAEKSEVVIETMVLSYSYFSPLGR